MTSDPDEDEPPRDWRVIRERFTSLREAWTINRALETELGKATWAFRWQGVPGSTDVIGEFWVDSSRRRQQLGH
jgi:hypothetical protein